MSSSFFDIVVAGADLSGLVMAAVAAKRGYRVLVVGQGHKPDSYDYRGFRFYRRPHLFHGLGASPAAEQVLVELGLSIDLRNMFRAIRPRFQFVTPRARVDFDSDPRILERELKREFPGQLPRIERYLREEAEDNATLQAVLEESPTLPVEGLRERRRMRRWMSELAHLMAKGPSEGGDPLSPIPPGHPARTLLSAPVAFLAHPGLRRMGYAPWLRAAVHAAQGFHVLDGGWGRLREVFIDRIVAHCGSYRPNASIDELVLTRGRVRSVVLRRSGETIGCKLVVCNSDPKRFFQLVPHEHQKERFHHAVRSLQPSHYLATLNIALRGPVVQEGLCPVAFLQSDESAAAEEENLIVVTTAPETYRGAEGDDRAEWRVVTASCHISARRFAPRADFAREVAGQIKARLAGLIPFLEERQLASHLTWQSREGSGGDFDMTEVIPVYTDAVPGSLDASPMPSVSGYKNILQGGDTLLSGFGLEGAFMGGVTLVHHATRLVVLKSILHD